MSEYAAFIVLEETMSGLDLPTGYTAALPAGLTTVTGYLRLPDGYTAALPTGLTTVTGGLELPADYTATLPAGLTVILMGQLGKTKL